jgi:hypothetical protein
MPDDTSSPTELFNDFLKSPGWEAGDLPSIGVLEFVSGDFVVTVLPHPRLPKTLLLEISIRALALDDDAGEAGPLLLLHRLNNAGRFEHGWSAMIDEEDMLLLTATRALDITDATALEEEIADGLERARALNELWLDAGERDAGAGSVTNFPMSSPSLPIDRA